MRGIEHQGDWALLEKIKNGDPSSFEEIYIKYAAMMFGCILEICKDQALASRIFKNVFLNLKDPQVSKTESAPFSFWLWQHTGKETIKFLNKNYAAGKVLDRKKAIIDYLCFNKVNRAEAAAVFNISSSEIGPAVKKDLQSPN